MKETFTDRDVMTRGNRAMSDTNKTGNAPGSSGASGSTFGGTTASSGTTTSSSGAMPSSSGGGAATSFGSNAGSASGALRSRDGEGVTSKMGDELGHSAEQQKMQGADFVGGLAGAVRRAAGEFEGQVPQAAQYIRLAADQLDGVADAVRRRDFNRIMADVQNFARQRPVAFFGAAIFVGFAAMRLLKTSAPPVRHVGVTTHSYGSDRHWSPPTAMHMPE